MKPLALLQFELDEVVVPGGEKTKGFLRCQVIYDGPIQWIRITPVDDLVPSPPSLMHERMSILVQWAWRASRQFRALIERGQEAQIQIPHTDVGQRMRTTSDVTVPPVGHLLRPLVCEFEARPELRSFQRSGVSWLLEHPKGILADDMGLGKTLQVLEATRRRVYEGSAQVTVILCPRTLTATWESEAKKWAPELTVAVSTTWTDDPEALWNLVQDARLHLVVIHYDQLKSVPSDALRSTKVDALVMDEAHRVRRAESDLTSVVREINARSTWALSGTPIERDTEDLATLMSVVDPERFSPSMARLGRDALRALAKPLLLRRRKSDVLDDLPQVSEQIHEIDLLPAQRDSYLDRLREARSGSDGELLAAIGDLLAICDVDPASGASAKLEHISQQIEHVALAGEKAVVFSYRLAPLDALEGLLEEMALQFVRLDGRMSTEARESAIDTFRSTPDCVALLASSRVASEGLTLTEANHAFFVNRWWNPSSNDQARDRIVRIGQQRNVVIHTYVCRGTLEERLEMIIETKRDLVSDVVDALALGGEWSRDRSELENVLQTD